MTSERVIATRLAWIDDIKLFAICCVMVGHVSATFFANEPGRQWLHHVLISWSMPLFFFVSGITSWGGISRIKDVADVESYVRRMAYRLMVPSLTFAALLGVIDVTSSVHFIRGIALLAAIAVFLISRKRGGFDNHRTIALYILYGMLFAHIVGGVFSSFWFFPCLLRTLIIPAIIFGLTRPRTTMQWMLCASVVYVVLLLVGLRFDANAELGSYYLLGLFLRRMNQHNHKRPVMVVPLLAIAVVATYNFRFHSFYGNHYWGLVASGQWTILLFRQLAGIAWCMMFWQLFMALNHTYDSVSRLGSKTLAIYGVHVVLIETFRQHFFYVGHGVSVYIYELLFVSMLLTVSTIIIRFAMMHWITRQMVCGNQELS